MRAVCLDFESSRLSLCDHPEPAPPGAGQVLLRLIECGVCGTDRGIAGREFGAPPPGRTQLVLGHEGLGVVEASLAPGLESGQLVVPMVRRSCSAGCAMCLRQRRDLCQTGEYSERGIFGLDGYLAEYAVDAVEDLVPVPHSLAGVAVLVEPASVVEKAWELALRLHQGEPARTLILGAGPVGILAAWKALAADQAVTVFSLEPDDAPGPSLLRRFGASYTRSLSGVAADIVIEACGSAEAAMASMAALGSCGVLILLGARPEEVTLPSLAMIIGNQVIAGSVNASRAHFDAAVESLRRYSPAMLEPLITRLPLDTAPESILTPPPGVIKLVHTIAARGRSS